MRTMGAESFSPSESAGLHDRAAAENKKGVIFNQEHAHADFAQRAL
jgi:hypothetical protein